MHHPDTHDNIRDVLLPDSRSRMSLVFSGSGEEDLDPSVAAQAYVMFLGQSCLPRHIVIESG